MNVHVINPNHPATQLSADEYRKLLAILVRKYCPGQRAEIDVADVAASDGTVLATHFHRDTIEFFITTQAEAERLAREAGGLPI